MRKVLALLWMMAMALPAVPARAADADSAESIVKALYDVISGPAGPRDWDRFRALFAPGARLIPVVKAADGAKLETRVMTPDDYAKRAGANFEKNAFYEREASRKVESYGAIMHVFSAYESRRTPGGEPFASGTNSIQLYNDGQRWWIVTVMWDSKR